MFLRSTVHWHILPVMLIDTIGKRGRFSTKISLVREVEAITKGFFYIMYMYNIRQYLSTCYIYLKEKYDFLNGLYK